MKKYLFIFIIILFSGYKSFAQESVTWETLSLVKWVPAYFPSLDGYYDFPKFDKKISKLSGKQVTIKGFYVPVDLLGKVFALSAQPSSMCFFCGGSGPESVMEIVAKSGKTDLKSVKADKYIELKGKLKLNKTDPEHLMYILEDAELVKIIQ